MYRIERQDQLYKALPRALLFSPIIVVFSALTLLPLSGVFAPCSLTITTKISTDLVPCMIPTGNLTALDSSTSFYTTSDGYRWSSAKPTALAFTTQCFVEKRIPDLPLACGPNCRYKVHVPSFVFQCTPNPSSLPYGQRGIPYSQRGEQYGQVGIPNDKKDRPYERFSFSNSPTLWNGTRHLNSTLGFYIAWNSNSGNGIFYFNVDSRSKQKEVSSLLRQTSHK